MSRFDQSHRGAETQRRGDGATGRLGDGKKALSHWDPVSPPFAPSPRRPVAQSPRRLVALSLCLRLSVAITLVFFAVACRQDMQDQPKYKPLAASRFFSDGKSARQLVDGTVPFHPGVQALSPMADESKATTLPFALTAQALDRGQERFNIYCAPCHGRLGYGDGMVVQRGFLAPPSYHIDRLRQAPVGHFYDVMTNGFGAMPSYADKVAPRDRWAIVAYIRALQLSQRATLDDATPAERNRLEQEGQKQ
jgi:mono/diheme cytochrome c family protein